MTVTIAVLLAALLAAPSPAADPAAPIPGAKAGDAALGTRKYADYEKPQACAGCHVDISRQHEQAMMSQAFTHAWDEIEYFELAVPHAEKVAKVAGVKAGCNGCHAPLAFLAGDVPPKRPSERTRANEGVSCDVCHTIVGRAGDPSVNFNWVTSPGKTKQGNRAGVQSPFHDTVENPFLRTAEFCGTCHNEQNPWGVFVKSTQLEWKEASTSRRSSGRSRSARTASSGRSSTPRS